MRRRLVAKNFEDRKQCSCKKILLSANFVADANSSKFAEMKELADVWMKSSCMNIFEFLPIMIFFLLHIFLDSNQFLVSNQDGQ